jgi:hypothetical protein
VIVLGTLNEPEVPVTVMMYVPGVVPGLRVGLELPQAVNPPTSSPRKTIIPTIVLQLRLRAGIANNNRQPKVTPPAAYQQTPG